MTREEMNKNIKEIMNEFVAIDPKYYGVAENYAWAENAMRRCLYNQYRDDERVKINNMAVQDEKAKCRLLQKIEAMQGVLPDLSNLTKKELLILLNGILVKNLCDNPMTDIELLETCQKIWLKDIVDPLFLIRRRTKEE